MSNRVGNLIRKLREERGMSQRHLAQAIGYALIKAGTTVETAGTLFDFATRRLEPNATGLRRKPVRRFDEGGKSALYVIVEPGESLPLKEHDRQKTEVGRDPLALPDLGLRLIEEFARTWFVCEMLLHHQSGMLRSHRIQPIQGLKAHRSAVIVKYQQLLRDGRVFPGRSRGASVKQDACHRENEQGLFHWAPHGLCD